MQILSRLPSDFLPSTEVWHVRADHIDQVFRICISGPELPLPNGAKIGAVYSTDADLTAGAYASAIQTMTLGGDLPPLYSISIGYPVGHRPWHIMQRLRDLLPTPRPELDAMFGRVYGSPDSVSSGGGDAFLDFIINELRPAIEAEHPIDPSDATLAGVSAGGLFAAHAFTRDPESFGRYLIISPNLGWHDRLVLRRLETLTATCAAPTVAVAFCVGELERMPTSAIDSLLWASEEQRELLRAEFSSTDTEALMLDFARIVAPWIGRHFRLSTAVLAGESHYSEVGAALSWGLRRLFASAR
jgi:predicted alpha/beta superfamily hydrolase